MDREYLDIDYEGQFSLPFEKPLSQDEKISAGIDFIKGFFNGSSKRVQEKLTC
jgi:hypothetical protein